MKRKFITKTIVDNNNIFKISLYTYKTSIFYINYKI